MNGQNTCNCRLKKKKDTLLLFKPFCPKQSPEKRRNIEIWNATVHIHVFIQEILIPEEKEALYWILKELLRIKRLSHLTALLWEAAV